jgi:UDPglucose 6-dehydrogenase
MRIAVIGSWHQSSVLAACFAEIGHAVVGIASEPALSGLVNGRAPVYEPGLDDLLTDGIRSDRLRFDSSYEEGLRGAEFAFIAIDTPVDANDDSDLSLIWNAVDRLAAVAPSELVVIVTAQVPVGTCSQIASRVGRAVAYVPEFLRLGTALDTFRRADRFVVGADDSEIAARVAKIYEPLDRPMYFTDVRSAEMAKHASNAFLATSISFINQISDLCEQVDANVNDVAAILKLDSRIGPKAFLSAGLGYAGGTLGREIKALERLGAANGVTTELFEAVEEVNRKRVDHAVALLRSAHPDLRGIPVTLFGLTYKTGTSTLRRSASIDFISRVVGLGATVAAFDPLAQLDESAKLPRFKLHRDPQSALRGATTLVLMAPWPNGLELGQARQLMKEPIVVDTANYLDRAHAREAGFDYRGIGR